MRPSQSGPRAKLIAHPWVRLQWVAIMGRGTKKVETTGLED